MHPSQVKQLNATVYGGDARGSVVSVTPVDMKEVLTFLKEVNLFLATGDARMVEITMINGVGEKSLRQMYKQANQEAKVYSFAELESPWTPFNINN